MKLERRTTLQQLADSIKVAGRAAAPVQPGDAAHEIHHLEVERGPLGVWRRRALVQDAKDLASRYKLDMYVKNYLARATRADLTGLTTEQLLDLVQQLRAGGVAVETVCDWPEGPPAR